MTTRQSLRMAAYRKDILIESKGTPKQERGETSKFI